MVRLPDDLRKVLHARSFPLLGTVDASGRAQVTPVWVDVEGDTPLFNTAVGRPKHRHMLRDPRVCLTVTDPTDDYRYWEIRGTVTLEEGQAAEDMIDALALKYLGRTPYPSRAPGERRVLCVLAPERIFGMGI
jgi:PPOX class probable F420-dependent enzyme